jgi:hypothetical protein
MLVGPAPGMPQSNQIFGHFGIDGDNWNYTVQNGSHVTKLSILGHRNMVTVEEGVVLYDIETAGHGNIVSLPAEQFILRWANIGKNQLVRRPPSLSPTETSYAPYTPYMPPTESISPAPGAGAPVPVAPPEFPVRLPDEAETVNPPPAENEK